MRQAVEERLETGDSEITLSATTLLGIFFGLVLICGVFFGFGYSTGRRGEAAPAPSPAPSTEEATQPSAAPQTPKPSAMQALEAANTAGSGTSAAPDQNTVTESLDEDATPKQPASPAPKQTASTLPAASSAAAPAVKAAALAIPPSTLPAPTAMGTGSIMVQIAAVTRSEDANALASALRQRGYTVAVRSEPQDKLLHVQVGPFATRDAAKAMRAKLMADGYNAILKP